MHTPIRLTTIAAALLASACGSDPEVLEERGDGSYRYVLGHDEVTGETIYGGGHLVIELSDARDKFEAIDDPNRASRLHPALGGTAYTRFDAALTAGETDWNVFASNWWPQSKNGTAFRWQPGAPQDYNNLGDRDRLSPLEKYDLLAHPGQQKSVPAVSHCEYGDFVERGEECTKIDRPALTVAGPATQWELQHQGTYQQHDPESWWGHCNGWASYATSEPLGFPARDVRVKLVDGQIRECTSATDASCILFKMADVEALMTELYFTDQATFTGRRCETRPDKIERDSFGRPTDPKCRDLNAGALHIAMVGLLGKGAKNLITNEENKKPAFVIDHNYDHEVWNFPLVKFEIRSQEVVSKERANELIGATGSTYTFNAAATKFVSVRATYWMVSDGVPPNELLVRADKRNIPLHDVDLNYVLELDSADRILGGEWIKDPVTTWGDDSKQLHPDFAWMALDPVGPGENADDTGGQGDNPFVSYPIVQAILRCANDATSCADGAVEPGDSVCEDHCGEGPFVDGGKTCYCDTACKNYGDCCGGYAETCEGGTPDPTPAGSCEGHCGQSSPAPGTSPACYCDAACKNYGDCCADAEETCNL